MLRFRFKLNIELRDLDNLKRKTRMIKTSHTYYSKSNLLVLDFHTETPLELYSTRFRSVCMTSFTPPLGDFHSKSPLGAAIFSVPLNRKFELATRGNFTWSDSLQKGYVEKVGPKNTVFTRITRSPSGCIRARYCPFELSRKFPDSSVPPGSNVSPAVKLGAEVGVKETLGAAVGILDGLEKGVRLGLNEGLACGLAEGFRVGTGSTASRSSRS